MGRIAVNSGPASVCDMGRLAVGSQRSRPDSAIGGLCCIRSVVPFDAPTKTKTKKKQEMTHEHE